MKKVKRDFEEALKTYGQENGWIVVGDAFDVALQALYYVQKVMDKQDKIVGWITKHEKTHLQEAGQETLQRGPGG